ncbi:Gfo/Idh/MocA family oxidoreductase [Actinophytocola oryzae]|uniref:Myo-inositol 2-dehydrogenase/D-chiro-inositol 1-dehydrogenase n=1 Tax=Actinophytocola oryzae TaxID=502181 RepID=A0A4R7UUA2_9PSEU|nr:Gfo/Idh/MocA family oxidoreductase [Actinophytocola oryzae]TDV40020.1 myo-inositol 2-dehydrogenase/D-chiro-inositol 1-dehydrogenase [Actinophytocola oryzae]
MRIGVAGVGRIGTMHAANLTALPQVDEVLLYDPVPGRAEVAATADGARAVSDLDELLSASDGVLVATPTDTHPALVRACLAAGTPVLCEKPIAADLAAMRALVDEIEATNVPVLVGFQRRFDPAMVELRRRVVTGELGAIYHVRTTGFDASPPDFAYLPSSGGIFRDLLIHDLDAIPWLVGEPVVEVYASGSVQVNEAFAQADDVDNAVVLLRFAGGTHAVISGGRHDPLGYDHRIEVLGARDSVAVGLDGRTPLHTDLNSNDNAYPGFPERFRHAYRNEMLVFTEVLAGRADNPSPARDSLVSLGLADACEKSRRTGQPVRSDQ